MNNLANLCRCCLSTDNEMKDNIMFPISSIEEETLLTECSTGIHNTEVFIGINLPDALTMIGIKSDESVSAYHQICDRCERALKFCLEFHQMCVKSIHTLKNIKEEGLDELSVQYEDEKDLFDEVISDNFVVIDAEHNNFTDSIKEDPSATEENERSLPPRKPKRKKPSQFSQVLLVRENRSTKRTSKKYVKNAKELEEDKAVDDKFIKNNDSDVDNSYFQEDSQTKQQAENIFKLDTLNKKSITTAEATLDAKYVCYHCDCVTFSYLKYVKHRETHKKTKGFTSINRICNLCNNSVEGYIQHLQDRHRDYRPNCCSQCSYSTNNQYGLVQHMVKHLTKKTLQCQACNDMFSHPKSLSVHVRTHFDVDNYFCPICGFYKSKISELLTHKAQEHPDDDQNWFPCNRCKRIYFKYITYETHKCTAADVSNVLYDEVEMVSGQIIIESEKCTSPQKPCDICDQRFKEGEAFDCHRLICVNHQDYFKCTECNIQFRNRRALRKHKDTKHSTKEFFCEFCSRRFTLKVYLQAHLYSHTDVRTEQCNICLKMFKSKMQLSLHKQIHREKEFECAKCGKKFVKKDSLKSHLRKHFKVLCREKCQICGKMFGGLTPLRIHMRVHTGERPFCCVECNKFYYSKHALKTHNEKIHMHKRFDCKYCDKSFSAIKSIHEHAFTHKPYMPFNCTMCPKKFSRKDAFKKHLQEHNIMYDEAIHGFTGESFHDVVMSVLKNSDDQLSMLHEDEASATGGTITLYDGTLQIMNEEVVEEEIIDFDDEDIMHEAVKNEIVIVETHHSDDGVFDNYLISDM